MKNFDWFEKMSDSADSNEPKRKTKIIDYGEEHFRELDENRVRCPTCECEYDQRYSKCYC